MRRRDVLYGSLAIAAASLVVACGDEPLPTKPSQPSTSQFAGVQVMGPDSLGAGQSAQFVAKILQADGTTKSATSMPNLRWRSSDPSVASVSNSGVVAATSSGFGEALITADITPPGVVQGTRKVVIRPKAVVTAELEISQQGTPGQISYVFAVTLTESAGTPATVTSLWATFDAGWGGQCSWTPDKLGQTRLPANGTLVLGPLTCSVGYDQVSDVVVEIDLKDDIGYTSQIFQGRQLVVR
jgi:hypothetical protein